MKKKYLKFLICPASKSSNLKIVNIKKQSKDEIIEATIKCQDSNEEYLIKDSIPLMLSKKSPSFPEMSFDKQWLLKKLKLLEPVLSSGKKPEERYNKILNIFKLNRFPDKSVFLDAGCGNGVNGLEVAKNNPTCTVVMLDVSIQGLKETYKRAKNLKNVFVLQSDLLNLAIKDNMFDYIWSEGVLHHTKNTYEALVSVEKTLKRKGMLYIWLYANYKKSYYLIMRDITFNKAYKLPFWLIYFLSVSLSLPYFIFNLTHINIKKIIQPSTKKLLKHRPLASIIFSTYDSLNPKYQFRHSKEEAISWLSKLKYINIKIVGDLGLVAKKK